MPIKSVECKDNTGRFRKFFGHREYKCTEKHSDGKTTIMTHTGPKGRIKTQIESFYGDDVKVTGLKG